MGWAAARLGESEQEVCRLLPQPIAATWREVLLARTAQQALARLDACLLATCAVLGTLALVEYLRGPARDDAEAVLGRLSQPQPSDWLILLQNMLAVLRNRTQPPLVLHPLLQWQVERVAGGASGWRRLEAAVFASEQLHKDALQDEERSAAQYLEQLTGVLQSLRWLGAWRLFRVQQLSTLRRRGFTGSWQFYAGASDAPEALAVQWTAHLEDNAVYLLSPDARQVLEVSPFFRVLPHPKQKRAVLYHFVQAPGMGRMEVRHQPERSTAQTRMEGPDGEMRLLEFLASRQLHDPLLVNEDLMQNMALQPGDEAFRPPVGPLVSPMAIPDLSPAPAALPRHLAAPRPSAAYARRTLLGLQLAAAAGVLAFGGWWMLPRLRPHQPEPATVLPGAEQPLQLAAAPEREPAPAPAPEPAPARAPAPAPAPAPARAPARAPASAPSSGPVWPADASVAAHLPLRPAFAELALLAAVDSDEPGARAAWTARFGARPIPALAPGALTARLVREASAIIYGPRHKPAEKRFMAKYLFKLAADRGERQGSLGLAKIYWYGESNAKACAEHALAAGSLPEAIRLSKLCQR